MGDKKSPNAIVKDDDTRILLDRRAEILEQINKLYAEYHAIEHVLVKLHRYEKPEGIEIDMQMERLQKLKQQSNWLGEDR
jgi:uncharacterized protein involved in tolerance to divalent cations